jgi:ectoine hydroxylase-related dioxygenase (phytanoyl-CoA dioxygenase family)
MSLRAKGFAVVRGVFSKKEVSEMLSQIPDLRSAAGTRNLLLSEWCQVLAEDRRLLDMIEEVIGAATPRRGILFDKNPLSNWNLGWHRDTKIAVVERREVEGYSKWSEKEGVIHCEPPREVLAQCLAARIHLDPCHSNNGPLRVIPESHLEPGREFNPEWTGKEQVLTAEIGDVIFMSPLTWHASSKASVPDHRRVIHIEYSSAVLACGLNWAFA